MYQNRSYSIGCAWLERIQRIPNPPSTNHSVTPPQLLPWRCDRCFVNRVGPATMERWVSAGRYRLVRARLLRPKQRPAKGLLNDLVVAGRRELNAVWNG